MLILRVGCVSLVLPSEPIPHSVRLLEIRFGEEETEFQCQTAQNKAPTHFPCATLGALRSGHLQVSPTARRTCLFEPTTTMDEPHV